MKSGKIFGSCVCLLTLMSLACGRTESDPSTPAGLFDVFKPTSQCAEANPLAPGESPSKTWRTVILEEPVPLEELETRKFGVEVTEEIKTGGWFEAGDSGIVRRKTCSRAFRLDAGKKVYLMTERVPGRFLLGDVREQHNYLLMSGRSGEGKEIKNSAGYLELSTGKLVTLATEADPLGGCKPAHLIPQASPSGAYFLIERRLGDFCNSVEPLYSTAVTVYDAQANVIVAPSAFENIASGAYFEWLNDQQYRLNDNLRTVDYTVP